MEQPAETDSLIGKELGAYHIVRKLGAGGMGVVFEATHRQIGQRVAIKLLHNHIARDGKTFQRFENEAKAIGRIKHPGLVNIHGYENTADGAAYIVMEYLQGESLYDRLERLRAEQKRIPIAQSVSLIRQVASALAEAHSHGIVHCDLKPENLFLVRDELVEFAERIKILDFGIAKFVADDGGRKTTVGLVLGTPIYMSPEQCEGRDKISEKADVYSLGVMFYELLAGEPPFRADSSAALMRKHMLLEPTPIASKVQGVPAGAAHALHRMLAKEPDPRPTMRELAALLEHPDRAPGSSANKGRRIGIAAAAGAVLLLGISAAVALRGGSDKSGGAKALGVKADARTETPTTTTNPGADPTSGVPAGSVAQPTAKTDAAQKTKSAPDTDSAAASSSQSAKRKKKKDLEAGAVRSQKGTAQSDADPASPPKQSGPSVAEAKAANPPAAPMAAPAGSTPSAETPKKKSYGAFR